MAKIGVQFQFRLRQPHQLPFKNSSNPKYFQVIFCLEKIHELIKNTFKFNDDWKVEIFMSTPPRRSPAVCTSQETLSLTLLPSLLYFNRHKTLLCAFSLPSSHSVAQCTERMLLLCHKGCFQHKKLTRNLSIQSLSHSHVVSSED